jgi:tripartite-type tricarboxylate transporter receptor subunit TctC
MKLLRLLAAFAVLGAALISAPLAYGADAFPSKPIRVVVPFPPGGLTDNSIRKLTELASQDLGQPFVIENKPGANGLIGTAQALRSAPDGYTLIAVTTSVVLISPILSKAPFDPLKDLSYILNYAGPSHALVVRADSPYKTLDDLLAAARAHPGELTFGTVGTSDAAYFGTMALSRAKGVKFNHIPYQGASQSLLAVVSGQTVFAPTSNYSEMVKAGKVRPLALLDKQRLASLPEVPTFTELGIDWQFPWITGIAVSAQTPEAIRQRLETAFIKAARSAEFAAFLQQLNVPLYVLDGAAMKNDLAQKIPQYKRIAEEFGLIQK